MSERWKWHKGWGSTPTWTPETHCNDGANGLTLEQKAVFDLALETARREGEGHATVGTLSATVNLRTGHDRDVARFAIWDGDRQVNGGRLAAARAPIIVAKQRRVFHWQLPDLHITVPSRG